MLFCPYGLFHGAVQYTAWPFLNLSLWQPREDTRGPSICHAVRHQASWLVQSARRFLSCSAGTIRDILLSLRSTTRTCVRICDGCQKSKITALSKCSASAENKTLQKPGNGDAEDLVIYNPSQCKNLRTVFLKVEAGSLATPSTQTRKEGHCPLSKRADTHFLLSLPGTLTCLHKDELWGLLANAVHSSAVIVPKVILRVWCHLWKEWRLATHSGFCWGENPHTVHMLTLRTVHRGGSCSRQKSQRQGRGGVFYYLIFLALTCQKHHTTSLLLPGCPVKKT